MLEGESAVEVAGLLLYVCDLELLIASVVFSDAIKSSKTMDMEKWVLLQQA